jgi:ribosomal protein L40E
MIPIGAAYRYGRYEEVSKKCRKCRGKNLRWKKRELGAK